MRQVGSDLRASIFLLLNTALTSLHRGKAAAVPRSAISRRITSAQHAAAEDRWQLSLLGHQARGAARIRSQPELAAVMVPIADSDRRRGPSYVVPRSRMRATSRRIRGPLNPLENRPSTAHCPD